MALLLSKVVTAVRTNSLLLLVLLQATASSKAVTVNSKVTLPSSKVDTVLLLSSRVATLLSRAVMDSSRATALPRLLATKQSSIYEVLCEGCGSGTTIKSSR